MGQKNNIDRISTLKQLPSLPHILLKLIRACNQDSVDLNKISDIIEKDTALASKILKLINSAYYGIPRKIESMNEAVCYLGTNAVRSLAISASVFGAFRKTKSNAIFNMKIFWWHSLFCAVLARSISKKTKYGNPYDGFLCGLLHDIGKLVLWVNFKKEYKDILKSCGGRQDDIMAGEIQLIATHSEIGAWLLEQWKLETFMVDSVRYHHEPLSRIQGGLHLVKIIYVSDRLGQNFGYVDKSAYKAASEIFKLSRSEINNLHNQAIDEVKSVARSFDIEIEPPADKKPVNH